VILTMIITILVGRLFSAGSSLFWLQWLTVLSCLTCLLRWCQKLLPQS